MRVRGDFSARPIPAIVTKSAPACIPKLPSETSVVVGEAMDQKTRPNHQRYLEILSKMTPAQKLNKVFELTEMTRKLFRQGLRNRFPDLSESELHRLYLERLAECHNQDS